MMKNIILGTLVFVAGVVAEKKLDLYKKAIKQGKSLSDKAKDLYKDCCQKIKENVEDIKEDIEDVVEDAKSETKD